MSSPKECPFCGGGNIRHLQLKMFCMTCGASGPIARIFNDAMRQDCWDTRGGIDSYEAEKVTPFDHLNLSDKRVKFHYE